MKSRAAFAAKNFFIEHITHTLWVGSMECLKSAVVIPLIKELDCVIDRDVLKNYRPVSNLLFLEKIIERVVSMRLNKHMEENNLHSPYQYSQAAKQNSEQKKVILEIFA